jgi:hypothetical protein
MSNVSEAALRYADLGYAVFPCAPGRKTPLTANGFHAATTDLDQIEAWWQRWPNANIAVPTRGLVVIDVDGPENPWLVDEPDRLAELASNCVSTTPSGGRHYFFRQPEGDAIRCQTGRLAPHVDVRADGGYVLVPPSVVAGKAYRWVEGLELDQPLENQRPPPPWLVEKLSTPHVDGRDTRITPGEPDANPIPKGQRNATLARLAGNMRRFGMSRFEIWAALQRVNADRCVPPVSPAEVERIASSISTYAPDQISVAVVEDHYQQVMGDQKRDGPFEFEAITSQQLDENEYELEYLINGILVRGQPGVIAGPKKSLKTNISIDLALSLSSGGKFLGHFAADDEVRVGLMSGESGAATIQETARRIAASKRARLPQYDKAIWSFALPQLNNKQHIAALDRFITTHELDVLILDPTYLMMLGIGNDAGNLFAVGEFLKSLGDLAQATNCTPLLCHHLKKGVADPYEPAELENIAWAGFQEFVRQWILLNRRVRYDPDRGGHHELWMSVGGSAGHSGLWGLNIDEGTRQDIGGRRWEVEVLSSAEAYASRVADAEEASIAKKELGQRARRQRQAESVLRVLEENPEGETSRSIRELAGINSRSIGAILDELLEQGEIEHCTVQKNTRQEPAFRLARKGGGTGGT